MRKNTSRPYRRRYSEAVGILLQCRACSNVPIHDIAGNVAQAKRLEAEGC